MVQTQADSGPRRGLGPKARTPPGKQKKKSLEVEDNDRINVIKLDGGYSIKHN